MNAIYDFFAKPIGWLLNQLCELLGGNFALSIFIFTLLLNIVFLPLNIKQQKTTANQARMKNKMDKIKEKYKDDRMAQQQAMSELMQESGTSPMSGCLLMFIRLPFFVAIYTAVRQPLTYLVGAPDKLIEGAKKALNVTNEMDIIGGIDKVGGKLKEMVGSLDLSFFGIDLTEQPSVSTLSIIWIIPLLSFATAILSTYITTQMQKKTNPGAAQGAGCMYVFMPLFSLVIAFTVPGAVGFYWACSNVVSMLISIFTNKMFGPARTIAQIEAKTVLNRMKYENEKIEAALKREEAAD